MSELIAVTYPPDHGAASRLDGVSSDQPAASDDLTGHQPCCWSRPALS